MNDLRSPLEDRPFRPSPNRSDERVIATSEYYRTKFGSIRQSRWFPLASVIAAVLVFSGIVSYAYKQGSQSGANATTPIIEANADSIKQKPENPGGMEVPFQDAVVFDQLQKTPDGAATEKVENLLAPPEQPASTTAATTTEAKTADATTPVQEEAPVTEEQTAPLPAATSSTETIMVKTDEKPATAKTETIKDVVAKTAETKTEEVKKMAETAPASTTPATKIQSGTYRIQMGAFRDEAAARAAWSKFQKEFSAQLANVTPDFPRADLPKGTFYRVQGINLSKASADELCRHLNSARSGSCMVVK